MSKREDIVEVINHPEFENFIRAFWRRIEPYKNDYAKELPGKMPVEFKASMATALLQLEKMNNDE